MGFMYYCILCLTYTREKALVMRTLYSGCQGNFPSLTNIEVFPLLSFSQKQLRICCTTEYLQQQGGACEIYSKQTTVPMSTMIKEHVTQFNNVVH